MRTLYRFLGVLGVLVLIVAIVGVLMAKKYRQDLLDEKAVRLAETSATADLFLSSAQDSLLKAAQAVNLSNFKEAGSEMAAVRKNLEFFAGLRLPKDIKAPADFNAALTEIDSGITAAAPEVQKKVLALANTVDSLRNALKKAAETARNRKQKK